MHQTRKGNEWRFGMKCHIGVDAGSDLVHTITVTPANRHDITQAVRYRGLRKNKNRLYAMFACANLYSLAIAGQTLAAG